ncbi:MAG: hypothetical protein QOG23_2840 [Blastocatellia bacterium]|jgi:hypothetical protein|nr:hypothetical protein [Blastocatellia bacterium]
MNQPNSSSANGNNHRPAVDVLDDNPHSSNAFYDPSNPLLAPPKQVDETKQKSRKRKLIILCFVFVLMAGSAFALYRLLKVNRVNVSVQADTRHDAQSAKTKEDSKGSDNNSSIEAIRLARQALGSDSPANNGSASPTPTPSPQENSTESTTVGLRSLSGTIYQPKPSDNGSTNVRTGSTSSTTPDQPNSGTNTAAQELAQSRANTTQTIYVGDSPAKAPATTALNQLPLPTAAKARPKVIENPAVLPPFGTMLPVRTQGVVFTLRNNSYARLELVRDMKGSGWSLPKGTVLIGRASGSEYDRAFITVIGYIDSRDNRLVKMSGEVLGSDGGSGIQGKRVVVDSGGLKRALSKIASSGLQAAGLLASGFGGQRTVIVDGAGNRIISPITDEASRRFGGASGDKRAFVKVEAGRPAYVMVADLPKDRPAIDAPGEDELQHGASLTDRELMELLILGTREEISAAIPLMTDEQKTLALKTLATGNEKK